MKKIVSILCCIGLISALFTGCSNQTLINGTWDYGKQSLLEFDYGCTIEQAEAYFGLTEADRVDVEENTSVTTYCYDIEDWGFGAAQLQITDTTERIGDEKYPLGVDVLRFIFIDKESEQKCSDFYKLQTNSCKKCYEIPNKDNISYCGYGDWNQYQNSACVAYLSSLGTPFNPEEWQKTKALVDCQYRNFGEFMNVSELKNRYDCVFRGVWYTYVKTDAYMKAKMDESR